VPTSIIWFRRDLRLSDHPALVEAVEEARGDGEVVPLFVLDDRLWGPAGDNRRAFLVGCLRSLDEAIGGHLVVRRGDPARVVAEVADEVRAAKVFVTADFAPYGTERDDAVEAALAGGDRQLCRVGSAYAVDPGVVRNGSGDPYKVFTPFSKAWAAHGWPGPIQAPRGVPWATGLATDGLPDAPTVVADLPAPGEAAAKRTARRFYDTDLEAYDEQRNDPGRDATSRLSPYLKWGCLHPRQLLRRLDGRRPGHDTFAKELAWRDFYADVLDAWPESARRSWNDQMAGMRVDTDAAADERFAAWCEGRTGFPIVDAGMRQLVAEGWMHNRVRMITASFLVKDLHVDWFRGARFFMEHLVDGDLPSDTHGWQWVAGTGTDAAPYFRIFNPTAQGERFDPDGTYVRRWVPELASVPSRHLHRPSGDPAGPPAGYPAPIVDHKAEREEALRRYAATKP
jgi:deoxyribodipyrimidine photo-lyase